MRGGVFSQLAHRIATIQGERYPLHVGDTWMEPASGARMEDLRVEDHPGLHRYSLPRGRPDLLTALSDRRGVGAGRILISAGATCGLGSVAAALLNPGDEVMLMSPYWPLIRGIVQINRGKAVEVPFYDRLTSPDEVLRLLEAHCTERTVALYLNTPNNPTGKILTEDHLRAIADFARARGLWIWADEVYEDYAFASPHVAIGGIAPERTFSVYSFSKAYGMAGNRCGYIIGPDADTMTTVRRATTHQYYCAPNAAQLAALRVLECGDAWLANANRAYHQAGTAAADTLGVPHPEGGTFLFIDVAEHLDESGLHGFLVRCIDHGLILAPGSSCGAAYGSCVRLCFTSAPPDVVQRGTNVLASLLRGDRPASVT